MRVRLNMQHRSRWNKFKRRYIVVNAGFKISLLSLLSFLEFTDLGRARVYLDPKFCGLMAGEPLFLT